MRSGCFAACALLGAWVSVTTVWAQTDRVSPGAGGFDPSSVLGILEQSAPGGHPPAPFPGLASALRVDESSGAAASAIDIAVPPGRRGMSPKLSVVYSSNRGNGLFGVGWHLPIGSIKRSTRHGVPFEYDNAAGTESQFRYAVPGDALPGEGEYILELGGSMIRLDCYLGTSGAYQVFGSAVEEAPLRVWFDPSANVWIVTDRSGVQYTYGGGGRRRAPASTWITPTAPSAGGSPTSRIPTATPSIMSMRRSASAALSIATCIRGA